MKMLIGCSRSQQTVFLVLQFTLRNSSWSRNKSLQCEAGCELAVHQLCWGNAACSCLVALCKKWEVASCLGEQGTSLSLCIMMWCLESCLQAHLATMAVWTLAISLWCPLLSFSYSYLCCCHATFYMNGVGVNFIAETSSYQAQSWLLSHIDIPVPHFIQQLLLEGFFKNRQIFRCRHSLTCRIIYLIKIWLDILCPSSSRGRVLGLCKICHVPTPSVENRASESSNNPTFPIHLLNGPVFIHRSEIKR